MGAIILKNKEQVEGIRKSGHLARQALKYIAPFVKEGISTLELNDLIEAFLTEHGATAATKGYGAPKMKHPFLYASCTSINDVVCHGVPKKEVILKNGDILNIDVTAILNGYYGDTCTMFRVGTISNEAERLLHATKEALLVGIKECYPGNRIGNIGFEIMQLMRGYGYSIVDEFCGHGVGIHFHEEPEVLHAAKRNSGTVLRPGMIFTIEPMINQGKPKCKIDPLDHWTAYTIDGKLSAQEEHSILITETGFDVLTDIDDEYKNVKPNIQGKKGIKVW